MSDLSDVLHAVELGSAPIVEECTLPLLEVRRAQRLIGEVVAVALALTDEVHKVVTAVGIALIEDDAHIARLARGVKAEIIELLHHLTLVDVLIQAALGVRAAVLAEGVGQLREVILGLVALRPALEQDGSFFNVTMEGSA